MEPLIYRRGSRLLYATAISRPFFTNPKSSLTLTFLLACCLLCFMIIFDSEHFYSIHQIFFFVYGHQSINQSIKFITKIRRKSNIQKLQIDIFAFQSWRIHSIWKELTTAFIFFLLFFLIFFSSFFLFFSILEYGNKVNNFYVYFPSKPAIMNE